MGRHMSHAPLPCPPPKPPSHGGPAKLGIIMAQSSTGEPGRNTVAMVMTCRQDSAMGMCDIVAMAMDMG